jgi:hypothetical protein
VPFPYLILVLRGATVLYRTRAPTVIRCTVKCRSYGMLRPALSPLTPGNTSGILDCTELPCRLPWLVLLTVDARLLGLTSTPHFDATYISTLHLDGPGPPPGSLKPRKPIIWPYGSIDYFACATQPTTTLDQRICSLTYHKVPHSISSQSSSQSAIALSQIR